VSGTICDAGVTIKAVVGKKRFLTPFISQMEASAGCMRTIANWRTIDGPTPRA